jgi:hypothetical protein
MIVGNGQAYRDRAVVGWLNVLRRKPAVPSTPVAKHWGWRGLRRPGLGEAMLAEIRPALGLAY